MNLSDVMLSVAKTLGGVVQSTATAGSTLYLTDSTLGANAEQYNGGTLFITSGSNSGAIRTVSTFIENKFTWTDAFTTPISAGVTYAAVNETFPRFVLSQGINEVLQNTYITLIDETLVTVAEQEDYTLPTGVNDVRRVEIATNDTAPYTYKPSHYWEEMNGTLRFYTNAPGDDAKKIRLFYAGCHGALAETGTVNAAIDRDWLIWAAVAWIYRNLIQNIHKDNPTANELLNEAKNMEANAANMARKHCLRVMAKDPVFFA